MTPGAPEVGSLAGPSTACTFAVATSAAFGQLASLECALTSAEVLPEPLRAELQETYGCIVRQLYGSADGLMPCFECWAADGMHVPEIMILEITDPETGDPLPPGEPGAVTASVMNPYRPLLRFCNGDNQHGL